MLQDVPLLGRTVIVLINKAREQSSYPVMTESATLNGGCEVQERTHIRALMFKSVESSLDAFHVARLALSLDPRSSLNVGSYQFSSEPKRRRGYRHPTGPLVRRVSCGDISHRGNKRASSNNDTLQHPALTDC